MNVGHHIIATEGFDQPTSYANVFSLLGREGVLDPTFASSLEPMARMRNRLVHVYEDVDPRMVHELLGSRLDDFDRFAQEITAYLDEASSNDAADT